MALGGVETGNMKPKEELSAIPTETGIGLIPAEIAAVIASGPIILVAAVWLVSSESKSAITEKIATIANCEGLPPRLLTIKSPTH